MEEIHYLLGNSCNLSCEFCFWGEKFSDPPLDFKKRIIDSIAESGINLVTLSGGEPTISNDFLSILEYMRSKGLNIILHTNGLILDEKLAYRLSKIVSRVSLTLDGSNEEAVFRMRGNREILKHTAFLIKIFNKLGVPVNAKTLVTKSNREDIPEIGNLLERLPVSYWSLLEFSPLNRGQKNKDKFFLDEKEFDEIAGRTKDQFPNIKINIRKYSQYDRRYCFIDPEGRVYTYIKGKGDIMMGDLGKESLRKIISRIEKK